MDSDRTDDVAVIFVGHGDYAAGVRDAAALILGRAPAVTALSLPADGSPDAVAERLAAELGRTGGEALVLADLMGGSPANAAGALALRHPALHLVSGLNLPMALEVLTSTERTAAGLAAVAARAGRQGVLDVAAALRAAAAPGAPAAPGTAASTVAGTAPDAAGGNGSIAPLPGLAEVAAAAERVAPYVRRTPVLRADLDGRPLVIKLEQLQATGSFKLRGALNALLAGPLPDRVVTASGGNHGLAVATAARLLDRPATVYVPESVPDGKARRIVAAGAELVRHGAQYAEAAAAAQAAAAASGSRYLPAYDDPAVLAGQGTVAREIVADAPEVDSIVVAVGGGGLAAGSALGGGGRTVVAVEPEHCRCLHDALAAGAPVASPVDSIAASALGAAQVGRLPFAVLRAANVVSVLVTDAELVAAQQRLWEEFRLVVEPAAAAPFAAWLAGRVPGRRPCLVACGANGEQTPY